MTLLEFPAAGGSVGCTICEEDQDVPEMVSDAVKSPLRIVQEHYHESKRTQGPNSLWIQLSRTRSPGSRKCRQFALVRDDGPRPNRRSRTGRVGPPASRFRRLFIVFSMEGGRWNKVWGARLTQI